MSTSLIEPKVASAPLDESSAPYLISPQAGGPIRAERLGSERLEALARQLAAACVLAPRGRAGSPLLRRFAANGRFLRQAHRRIFEASAGAEDEGRGLDAEWLCDNFHIIEEVLREVHQDLPQGYDAELPKLSGGPLHGYPRVYALALALVAHTDSELDEARLIGFVQAFQEVTPLLIGELWALPTMLRLVLLENLRRLSEQMLWRRDERRRADRWAADALDGGRAPARGGPGEVAGPRRPGPRARRPTPTSSACSSSSATMIRGPRRPSSSWRPSWTCAGSMRMRSSAASTGVRRAIRSPSAIASSASASCRRWTGTSSSSGAAPSRPSSARTLRGSTRSRTSRRGTAIARPSRRSPGGRTPTRGPSRAMRWSWRETPPIKARRGACRLLPRRPRPGRREGEVRLSRPLARMARPLGLEAPQGDVFRVDGRPPRCVLMALVAGAGLGASVASWWLPATLLVLLLPMSELAVGLVNHLLTLLIPPRILPKLDFKDGIAADCPTMVVMPSMLSRPQSAQALLERLEIHHLANPDPQLRFALLTDFADAPHETMPEDDAYLRDALERVQALNAPIGRWG